MNIYFSIAAVLSLGIVLLHTFMGGRVIAAPLLASDLPGVPKYTSYFCWHITTLALAGLAVMFAYAAYQPEGRDVALMAVLLTGSIAIFGIVMPPRLRLKYKNHPQGWLFVPVALVGLWGCLT